MQESMRRGLALRAALVARRTELEAQLRGRLTLVRETSNVGTSSQGDLLRRINDALAHMDTGMYGRCADCGRAISDTRLTAMPLAVRCVTCEHPDSWQDAQSCSLRAG